MCVSVRIFFFANTTCQRLLSRSSSYINTMVTATKTATAEIATATAIIRHVCLMQLYSVHSKKIDKIEGFLRPYLLSTPI